MPSHSRRYLAGAALAVLSLAGCSSSGGGSASPSTNSPATSGTTTATTATTAAAASGVQRVTLHVTDGLRFQPATVTIHPGAVTFTLIDDGSYPHNLSFPMEHHTSAAVTGSTGAQSTTMTMTFPKAGTFRFQCNYHDSAGMVGRVIVRS